MVEFLPALDSFAGLAVLAAIAFCDTLIGVGFFIYGEVAFLAAGASLSSSSAAWPALTVLAFAGAGDMTSYLIGKRFGMRLSFRFLKQQKRRQAWRRVKTALATRGAVFVVISRLLGPVAWITPFMAGAMGMPRHVFVPAAALGVFLGVGQFLLLGAIGQQAFEYLLPFLSEHLSAIVLTLVIAVTCIVIWRQSNRPIAGRMVSVTIAAVAIFMMSNFFYFFVFDTHPVPNTPQTVFANVCDAAKGPFLVHPGDTELHLPQPVNVILISRNSGAELMADLGWQQNVTFSRDQISFATYLKLLTQKTPPVSELYYAEHPADTAFQMPGTLRTREQIRWWTVGDGVQFGAVSKDEELAIKYYAHLPVLLHDISPMVDRSRDLLAAQMTQSTRFDLLGIAQIAPFVSDEAISDFETDGGVLVLTDHGRALPPDVINCLRIQSPR